MLLQAEDEDDDDDDEEEEPGWTLVGWRKECTAFFLSFFPALLFLCFLFSFFCSHTCIEKKNFDFLSSLPTMRSSMVLLWVFPYSFLTALKMKKKKKKKEKQTAKEDFALFFFFFFFSYVVVVVVILMTTAMATLVLVMMLMLVLLHIDKYRRRFAVRELFSLALNYCLSSLKNKKKPRTLR